MPSLTLKIAGPVQAPAIKELVEQVVALTTEVLGKKKEVTTIAVDLVPAGQWFVAGRPLAAGRTAFFLEVNVTEGTNTKDEKAAFLKGAYTAAEAVLGALEAASYIAVREVRGDAYGYGGVTQEHRYIQSKTPAQAQAARLRAL